MKLLAKIMFWLWVSSVVFFAVATHARADVNYAIVRDPIYESTVLRWVPISQPDGSVRCAVLDPRDWIFVNGRWQYQGPGVDVSDLCQDIVRRHEKVRA